MKSLSALALFLIMTIHLPSLAQDYGMEANVPQVEESGFYRIFLAPQITSKLQRHYPDIRIYNEAGDEIPFLHETDNIRSNRDSIATLKIIKQKHRLIKSYTSVVIKNDSLEFIDNFAFSIDNVGFRKWLKIMASENKTDWYVLKDNFPAQASYSDSSKTELLLNNIPRSSFPYYEIIFYDYDNQAVKVYNSYTYRSKPSEQNYVRLPEPKISHTDTLERTIVELEFESPQFVDLIRFKIEGPNFFFRNAVLKKPGDSQENEGKLYYDELNRELVFSSEKDNSVSLSHFKIKQLQITIDNRNNQSLRIKNATAYQQKSYITAYLKAGENYHLLFSNPKADFPIYDLEFFKDQIPQQIQVLKIGTIKHLKDSKKNIFSSGIWDMPPYYLWIGMGLVGGILFFLTAKLVWKQYRSSKNQKD